jgi:predicted dehydrogenase
VAVKCIEKGIHLLIEKPVASTVADGEKIAELSQKNDVKVVVGHIERFNPVVQQLKKEIARHEVFTITITRIGPIPPRIADVGVLTDLSVHDIDLIRFLTGREIAKTNIFHSKKSTEAHEDNAVLTFELEGSIIASIITNWLTPFKRRKIEVATRTAYYEADLASQELWEYSSFKKDNSYVSRPCFVRKNEPLRNELTAFLELLEGQTTATFATVEDSLTTLRVIG